MAATAYAALVSLMNTVEHILNHPRHSLSLDKKQIETLGEKVSFLEEFLESYSHGGSSEIEDLERQIASAAHKAEDVMESHIVDQIHAFSDSLLDLRREIEDMDHVKEKAMKLKEERGFQNLQPAYSTPASSSTAPLITTDEKSKMVGCDDELIQLMELLTGQQANQQIISIVGMGGIGKTTLAKNAFEHPCIVHHFDILRWISISQEYNVKEILSQLLSGLGKSTSEDHELGEQLYKSLSGRRYLIILDDMWSVEVWNRIRVFFPDNNNRSRIVVTTRESNVANHFGSLSLAKRFLDDGQSWNLFCEKVFGQEDYPSKLEGYGKMIVEKCKGLPLSIVVIGGLLRKLSRSQKIWKNVAKDISSILISGEDNQCFNLLFVSYSHLPIHLKPCFLYMRVFPEDHKIRVSQLIKVWVAEGFLKPNKAQNLEEVAEGYFKDLVDRNLILVHSLRSNKKPKTCYIHDVLRDVCLRIAIKEKFFFEVNGAPRGMFRERHVAATMKYTYSVKCPLKCEELLTRSLTVECDGNLMLPKSRLLRVLNVVGESCVESIFHQFNLRYIACKYHYIRKMGFVFPILLLWNVLLWNVQTLIFI